MYFSDFGIRIVECGILKSAISDLKLREGVFSVLGPGFQGMESRQLNQERFWGF
jgi:hypothetical protein